MRSVVAAYDPRPCPHLVSSLRGEIRSPDRRFIRPYHNKPLWPCQSTLHIRLSSFIYSSTLGGGCPDYALLSFCLHLLCGQLRIQHFGPRDSPGNLLRNSQPPHHPHSIGPS